MFYLQKETKTVKCMFPTKIKVNSILFYLRNETKTVK